MTTTQSLIDTAADQRMEVLEQAATPLNIGILGAGRVGTAVARQAARAGHSVKIATSRPAEEIQLLTEVIVPGAKAVNAEELRGSDLIFVAVPLSKYRSLDLSVLESHVVVDAMNYWAPVDGFIEEFDGTRSTSEVIEEFLGDVRLVKTLNHIGYGDLEVDWHPKGSPRRRALAVASNDEAAKDLVAGFVDSLGYDPVDAGVLAAGRAFENGTEIFNGRHDAETMRTLLTDYAAASSST